MSARLRSCAAAMVRATCVRDWGGAKVVIRSDIYIEIYVQIRWREKGVYQVEGVLSGRLLPEQGNGLGVVQESCGVQRHRVRDTLRGVEEGVEERDRLLA